MVRADTYTWEPGETTDSWHHADNWDLTAVPDWSDIADVGSGTAQITADTAYADEILVGAANCTAKVEATDQDIDCGDAFVAYASGAIGELDISGSEDWSSFGSIYVGNANNAVGTVSLSDGCDVYVADVFRVAYASGSTGSVSISGAETALEAGLLTVGHKGVGTLTQTEGLVDAEVHVGGHAPGAVGWYLLSGGTCDVPRMLIGEDEGTTGYFTLSDTGCLLSDDSHDVNLGCESGATGTYTQTGGSAVLGRALAVGDHSGATGFASLIGGYLEAPYEYVGDYGEGTFTHSGGTNKVTTLLCLGDDYRIGGRYALSGTGYLEAADEYIGNGGTAGVAFVQEGGTNEVTNDLFIAHSGSEEHNSLATYTQSGGYTDVGGTIHLAYSSYGTGSYTLSGGLLEVDALIPGSGNGTFNFIGGTLNPDLVGFNLINTAGVLSPGGDSARDTVTFVDNNYTQGEDGVYYVTILSGKQHDVIVTTGDMIFEGTVYINLRGFIPCEVWSGNQVFYIAYGDNITEDLVIDVVMGNWFVDVVPYAGGEALRLVWIAPCG